MGLLPRLGVYLRLTLVDIEVKGLIRHRLYTKLLILSTYMNFFTDIFALENVGFADILAVFIR